MDFYILLILFFVIALVYSSVGFGGGSSYLALMGVMAIPMQVMRPTALLCNIVVVTGGTIIFYREKFLDWKSSWPFLAVSIPAAFIGGYWPIKENTFFVLLGSTLMAASPFLWFQGSEINKAKSSNLALNLGLGGGIGFLSGLVSIGGGIFLSPILHFLKWDLARKISALASLFILVNSISGLAGQFLQAGQINLKFAIPLLLAVLAGGQIGSRLGARTFNPKYIKRITAVLILAAGANILRSHW